jgi:serine/threonine-protein kinase
MDIGSHLSHYTITAKLGEGGMGQVFRAEDSTLKRDVAIKVLPPEVADDPDRMRRLEREAQLLAQLNHPNIAAIHGLEEADGVRFLVMQLAEGRTLHERLDAGPIPLSEALPIAVQIARALESAHEKGVVHRDLKPANVLVADDGTVKLLDFGLAKIFAADASGSSASRVSESPTELATTQPGLILGTAGYMSPEQARGRSVDRRTDVWAFGCVLFEMLTAQRTFGGETITDVLGAIVHREPDWDLLPSSTPRRIRALLHRCLRKDVSRRIQAIGDARVSIEEYLEDPKAAEAILDGGAATTAPWRGLLPWAAAAVLAVALAISLLTTGSAPVDGPTLRLDMAVGVAEDLRDLSLGSSLVLSPDGSQIVIATGNNQDSRLQIRRLASTTAGTLTGGGAYNPFFSPDGAWVGFAVTNALMKVPATGGTPLRVVDVDRSRGADWGRNGEIVYAPSPSAGLMAVSADGGEPVVVTTLDETAGEITHRWPQVLPDGRHVLFTAHVSAGGFDAATIKVVDRSTGAQTAVYRGGYYGRYVESGHLLFVNDGTLFAVPFDLDSLAVVGSTAPVAEGIADDPGSGGAQFDVSDNGILVHRRGSSGPGQYPAVWLSRDGETSTLLPEARTYVEARVSSDGRRVAMTELNNDNWDVWVYDLARGTRTRLTFSDGIEGPAVWSPDGSELIYSSDADGSDDLWRKPADGSGEAVQLTHDDVPIFVSDWSSDGRYVLALRGGPANEEAGWAGGADIGYLDLNSGDGVLVPFLATRFGESEAAFSPDGRWVAYQSNESGRVEVYVRPFPPAGGRWQVSDEGGAYARWAADSRELYYRTDAGIMMVSVADGPTFSASRPRLLASGNFVGGLTGVAVAGSTFADYDVAPDGRFVMFPSGDAEAPNIQLARVVVNWFPELRRLVPRR